MYEIIVEKSQFLAGSASWIVYSFRFHTYKKNWYQYVTFAKYEINVWSISINFGV